MNTDLTSRRAVVCGSTKGIGRACALELASLGASVCLAARNESDLSALLAQLPKAHSSQSHSTLVVDFASPESVARAAERLASSGPWHILINNTGGPAGGPITDAAPEAFAAAFAAHVLASQTMTRALLPAMKQAAFGRIVNIISTSVKAPIPGLGVSNTIRAAMANWAKTLAGEVAAFGITVNNILPGFTDTDRLADLFRSKAQRTGKTLDDVVREAIASIPAGRLAKPEEIAAAAAFLCTPAASYVTGINVPVDGGRTPSL